MNARTLATLALSAAIGTFAIASVHAQDAKAAGSSSALPHAAMPSSDAMHKDCMQMHKDAMHKDCMQMHKDTMHKDGMPMKMGAMHKDGMPMEKGAMKSKSMQHDGMMKKDGAMPMQKDDAMKMQRDTGDAMSGG